MVSLSAERSSKAGQQPPDHNNRPGRSRQNHGKFMKKETRNYYYYFRKYSECCPSRDYWKPLQTRLRNRRRAQLELANPPAQSVRLRRDQRWGSRKAQVLYGELFLITFPRSHATGALNRGPEHWLQRWSVGFLQLLICPRAQAHRVGVQTDLLLLGLQRKN